MGLTETQRLAFALRTTLAALLAAYVAFLVNLPQASTSMITVFIVSQPLAGMALSKSFFRVAGTVVGASVAVAMTAVFGQTPELFAFAVSLWIGLCVTASVYLRDAPVSYAALLSGYSVAIIAFPAVDNPAGVFQAALDRGSEITVGIACATILSQILFPESAGDALARTTGAAIIAASRWAADTLKGRAEPKAVLAQRRDIIAKVSKLETLRVHASFDSPAVRLANRRLRLLHGRLVSFLALLVSIHDRLETLRAERPERAEALKVRLARAAEAMSPDAGPQLRAAARQDLIEALPDIAAMRADRDAVFERTILLRVADLVDLRGDIEASGEPDGMVAEAASLARYRDHALAFASGAGAFATLGLFCAFWIATGWNGGAGAAIMVAVMTSLFAQQDDPSAAAGAFLRMTGLGIVAAGVYVFAILPRLEGFEALAVALVPLLFAAAYAMSRPAYTLSGLAAALGALNLLGLTNVMTPDFASFANSAVGQIVGIGTAVAALRVTRPIGAAWPVARLVAGLRREIAGAIAGRRKTGRLEFESRMFDRIDGLMTRLDLSDPDQLATEQGALASLRVGLNAMALRDVVRRLPAEAAAPLAEALAELARHFRRLARGEPSAPPLARLDAALDAALAGDLWDDEETRDVPVWISSVRTSLALHPAMFGAAPPAVGQDESADALEEAA